MFYPINMFLNISIVVISVCIPLIIGIKYKIILLSILLSLLSLLFLSYISLLLYTFFLRESNKNIYKNKFNSIFIQ